MRTVLVTGGAGFLGSHVADALLARGDRVRCLDAFDDFYDPRIKRRNVERSLGRDSYELIEGDVRDAAALDRALEGCDAVIHLAARAGVRPSIEDPLLYEDVNVFGTLRLLEALRRRGPRSLVFGSSSSVYGGSLEVPFREDRPADRPVSPYAATKRAGELHAFVHHRLFGLDVCCLRFFTVYGPRQRPEMAIHEFARRISRGEAVPVFGDGSSRRDYTYVDDCVQGVLAALDRVEGMGYEVFNIGEDRTTSLLDLVRMIGEALGREPSVRHLAEAPGDVPVTWASIEKARRRLGYDPKTDVREGIRRFVGWLETEGGPR